MIFDLVDIVTSKVNNISCRMSYISLLDTRGIYISFNYIFCIHILSQK